MTRSSTERLRDIVARIDAIAVAESLLHHDDPKVVATAFDAILYDLLVIGEAVRHVSAEIRERQSHVPWNDITKMRNLLAHVYFRVREATVRSTIDEPLAQLRSACEVELERVTPER